MADTRYGLNSPETVKLFAEKLWRESLKETIAYQFMGNNSNSLIYIKKDAEKSPGDRIRCQLRLQLNGAGVEGDGTLEGNEEELSTFTDDLSINHLRNAVRSNGQMTEQRIPWSIREEARIGLTDWWADRIDEVFFNQVCGNTGQTDTRFTGHNATVAPSSNNIVYPDGDVSEADVASSSASSVFTLDLIDQAVEAAKTLSPVIRPIKVGNQNYYVAFLHPFQVYDLRTTTNQTAGQWLDIQKAALQGGKITDNPIFTGALGVHNNVILHENTRVPEVTTNVRRAVLCGAQAAMVGFGQKSAGGRMTWFEELFDYGDKLGVKAGHIWGMKKSIFNSQDFATIVMPSYAVQHN